jgi:hypothetical protein
LVCHLQIDADADPQYWLRAFFYYKNKNKRKIDDFALKPNLPLKINYQEINLGSPLPYLYFMSWKKNCVIKLFLAPKASKASRELGCGVAQR